jgi:hypothetical protein
MCYYIKVNVKKDRFKRIAEKRVNKLLDEFRLLGNCSNKANYDYTNEDAKKILTIIDKEVKRLREKFSQTNETERFKL